jgi:hypothetical protein
MNAAPTAKLLRIGELSRLFGLPAHIVRGVIDRHGLADRRYARQRRAAAADAVREALESEGYPTTPEK